jgi:hypothetical protein
MENGGSINRSKTNPASLNLRRHCPAKGANRVAIWGDTIQREGFEINPFAVQFFATLDLNTSGQRGDASDDFQSICVLI